MTRSVLFVCTGNTCRSPMAEHVFLKLCREAGLRISASSAGTQAADGMPLSRGAAAVFAERGLAPVAHRSRRVDQALLDAADAVYVMERAHLDDLAARFPRSKAKIFMLRDTDVEDPVGAAAAEYRACADSIEAALQIIVSREKESYAPNPR